MPAAEEGAAGEGASEGARRGETDGEEEGVRDGGGREKSGGSRGAHRGRPEEPEAGAETASKLTPSPRRPGCLLGGVCRNEPVASAQGASGERFDKYMAATTAAEFLELGGTRADLKYDIARGWVTVLDPR